VTAQQTQALYQGVWSGFVDRYGGALDAAQVALAERFGAALARWSGERQGPSTVVHGDYRLDNMLFGSATGGYPVAVVDWQTCAHGPGASDASYFLGAGLPVDVRRRHQRDLLR